MSQQDARKQRLEVAKSFIFNRQKAYQEVFKKESEMAKIVMADLAKFCRAEESSFNADPRVHALIEGRREVYLRIMMQLNKSSQELVEFHLGEKNV